MTERQRRIRIRAWRRGTREMDLILGGYADARLNEMSDAELDAFEAVLSENDQDLYRWVAGTEDAPAPHAEVLAAIRRHRGL